jgi:hypothetical protein
MKNRATKFFVWLDPSSNDVSAMNASCLGTALAHALNQLSELKIMAGDNSYKPGEIVKVSGIYSVVHEDGKGTFEVTCVEGEHFPPTRSGKGAHFELKYGATHSHKHGDLKGSEGK